jgi:uncharacterized membrane protein SpoIIM required for sporulation
MRQALFILFNGLDLSVLNGLVQQNTLSETFGASTITHGSKARQK